MRSVRQEILSTVGVFAVPLAVAFIFPRELLTARPTAATHRGHVPSVVFVTLSADEESAALARAKSAWSQQAPAARRMRFHLSLGDLPAMPDDLQIWVPTVEHPFCAFPSVAYPVPPWRPSSAAPAPLTIPQTPERPVEPTFSREDLLKL